MRRLLRHDDPTQLWFQFAEIVEDGTYLKHGITVEDGDVVLDVGANVGVAAVFFALGCGAGQIHSFEPIPPIFRRLCENTRTLPACQPHMYGISAISGIRNITYYPAADAMSGLHADPERDQSLAAEVMQNRGLAPAEIEHELAGRYDPVALSCEMKTISDALSINAIERVDLLKIDVERAELDVLTSIEDFDWPKIRQIVAEVHDEGNRLQTFRAMLIQRGFTIATEQEESMRGTDVHVVYAARMPDS